MIQEEKDTQKVRGEKKAMMHNLENNALKLFPFVPPRHFLPVLFPKRMWDDYDVCWLSKSTQQSPGWIKDRKGHVPIKFLINELLIKEEHINDVVYSRVTGSNFGAAAGRSIFKTPDDLANEIAGLKKKVFSDKSLKNMNHGNFYEPHARKWYEQKFGLKVNEVGLAVPKWNFHIGASVDGVVAGEKGIIEIKCPVKMYEPLKDHIIKLLETNWEPKLFHHSHIWKTHYDQMQGGMAILGMDWCDYIVYSTSDKQVYHERIPFNKKYWDDFLHPALNNFLEIKLFPLLEGIIQEKLK